MTAMSMIRQTDRPIGSTFNPLTQVAAIHALWADDPAWSRPSDGAAVSSWRNESGAGDPAQATGADQPTMRYSVAGLNNRGAVEFDGVTQFLNVDPSNTGHPWKAILVGKYTSTASNNKRWIGWGNSATDGFGVNSTGGGQWHLNNGAGAASATVKDANAHVFRMTVGSIAEGSELWMDETSIMSAVNQGSNNFNQLRIGATGSTTGALFAAVQIGFYAIYSNATSNTDLATLCDALQVYYATP
jgi:hypothetical protein